MLGILHYSMLLSYYVDIIVITIRFVCVGVCLSVCLSVRLSRSFKLLLLFCLSVESRHFWPSVLHVALYKLSYVYAIICPNFVAMATRIGPTTLYMVPLNRPSPKTAW